MNLRRGSISRGLHPTLRVPALEAAKVGNARRLSSYERQKQHRPRRSRNHCVHEFVVYFVADRGLRPDDDDFDAKVTVLSEKLETRGHGLRSRLREHSQTGSE